MTIFEKIKEDKNIALKNGDKARKQALTNMLDMIQKSTYTASGKVGVTDEIAQKALVRYQKQVQEMVDTCPEYRTELLEEYKTELDIVKEYAPQPVTEKDKVKEIIVKVFEEHNYSYDKNHTRMAMLAGKENFCDMKVVNDVWKELCN